MCLASLYFGFHGSELTSEKWLDIFTKAKEGDMHLQTVLARYSRLIAARREKEYMRTLVYEDMVHRQPPLFLNLTYNYLRYGGTNCATAQF